ncbi:MAG: hypothetical protein ABI847_12390, partial [Anaerolineales bacterium]
ARVIGTPDDDEPAEQPRRPATVAERHGYGRPAQPPPPARPAPPTTVGHTPASFNTRPVPKPAGSSLPPTRPLPARMGEGRPADSGSSPLRTNGGNGHSNGNGHSGNGNGNGSSGHAPSPSRSFDPDLDD